MSKLGSGTIRFNRDDDDFGQLDSDTRELYDEACRIVRTISTRKGRDLTGWDIEVLKAATHRARKLAVAINKAYGD
jgi:hypothetical protein